MIGMAYSFALKVGAGAKVIQVSYYLLARGTAIPSRCVLPVRTIPVKRTERDAQSMHSRLSPARDTRP